MRSIPIRLSILAAVAILALAAPPVAQGAPPDDEETLGPAADATAWLAGHGFTVQDPTVVDGVPVIVATRPGEATGEGESLARLVGDPENLAGMSLEMDLASARSAELLVRWLERFAPDAMTHVVAMLGKAGQVGGSFTDIEGPPVVAQKGATGEAATHVRIEVGEMAPAPVTATPQPTPGKVTGGPAAVEVVDQGFTQDETYATYAVVLRNPNTAWSVTSVPVDIVFLDADGGILDVASNYLSMEPDHTSAIAGQTLVEGTKSIEVSVAEGDHYWQPATGSTGTIEVSEVKTKQTKDHVRTTGWLESSFPEVVDSVYLVTVYRGKSGAILGGSTNYLASVSPDRRAAFKVEAYQTYPKITETEVYWHR